MYIFVINTGSSSIKYQLFDMPAKDPLCSGLVERIGMPVGRLTHRSVDASGDFQELSREMPIPNHEEGLFAVVSILRETAVIENPEDIGCVGHRVVHGGEAFAATTIINEAVKEEVQSLSSLAPLHNPHNLTGIRVAEAIFPKATQVAVFDTAFHQTMPPKAFRFAIPEKLYTESHIRAYGFHGTSHRYVSRMAADYVGKPDAKMITIHLGNGCSMAAVIGQTCVDTSMGLGPLGGLVMGTRSGDIDPAVIFHLIDGLGYSAAQVNNLLNKESGLLGVSGFSDMRDMRKAASEGDPCALLAGDLYAYRIRKYIGAYAAAMNGLDAIVFTAGVGENDPKTRLDVCKGLEFLGIELDESLNSVRQPGIRKLHQPQSKVSILVVPTNEELEIAQDCYKLMTENAVP